MKHILLYLLPFISVAQSQIGQDIAPAANNQFSSWYISLSDDGSTLATGGMPFIPPNEALSRVRVYSLSPANEWVQKGENIEVPGDPSEFWAPSRVSMSGDGNCVAVGTINYNVTAGLVRVHQWNGSAWVQKGQDLTAPAGSLMGSDVDLSLDGNTVLILAMANAPEDIGKVVAYQFIAGFWVQMGQEITEVANETEIIDFNQGAVSLSDDGMIMAIGISGGILNGSESSGLAKMYQFNGAQWIQKGQTIAGETGNGFGWDVALSADGETLAVGKVNGDVFGLVQVYSFIGNQWTQKGATVFGEVVDDWFGNAVALSDSGNILAVGAPMTDVVQSSEGRAKLFRFNGTNWQHIGQNFDGGQSIELHGIGVALSGSGERFAVSSQYYGFGDYTATGLTRVYDLTELLSSDEFVLTKFSIYPNPAQESISIATYLTVTQVNLYSLTGQLIKSGNSLEMNVAELTAGTYFIQVKTTEGKATKTFIKN